MDFLSNPDLDLIAIDPGSNHECYIERAQVQWVVNSPRNDGAKMALINDNMQQLLGSLVAPNSILVVAIDPKSEVQGPAFVPDDEGNPTNMLAFTSPIEVAAIDPAIEVRVAHAIEVLTLAEQLNARVFRSTTSTPVLCSTSSRSASSSILCVNRRRSRCFSCWC